MRGQPIYVRPSEAEKAYEALDCLMRTDAHYGDDEDLVRLRAKLFSVAWPFDATLEASS